MNPKQSRGYVNRNPGNLEYRPEIKWQGQLGIEQGGNPPRFARFATHELGIRALAAQLVRYQDTYECHSIRQIINRWAPPSENDTGAYVSAVAQAVGVGRDDRIDTHHYPTMRKMVEAIIRHECGGNPYEDTPSIEDGLRLAGIYEIADTVTKAATTKTGNAALTVAGITSTVAVVQPLVASVAALPQWTGVAVVVCAAALAAFWVIYNRMEVR